ncbi:hypothetical protein TRFO_07848 [Tritrichomonas foetus]|uniref:Histone chaperone RTT106/FACT complex subunit SPT16-like middle domain-containing protein n=1 Tax=Tritrichomonas foetus TaxID=1144522 RepID=A0A1J4JN33_9EUKA|nr:hypothetical protein TRFO_07848 [Tritrichomonas foetus]|eukprot:OHT00537.1 hypothetical protein TRFO_07848 [Tritrichomonas foetus]
MANELKNGRRFSNSPAQNPNHKNKMSKSFSVIVNSGKAKLILDIDGLIIDPESKGYSPVTLSSHNIDQVDFFLLGKFATIQIYDTGKRFYTISELKQQDKETIQKFLLDQINVPESKMTHHNVQFNGHNDGRYELREKSFMLLNDDRVILNLPYSKINQAQTPSVNDLMLEFEPDDTRSDKDKGESLFSVRFFIPNEAPQTAKDLRIDIDQRTDLTAGTEKHIAEIKDVNFVKPKKKYKLRFCSDLLFMYSQDVNHRIPYNQISMVHFLYKPSKDASSNKEEYILISLDRPIRQGQKPYPHLVISTSNSDKVIAEGIDESKTLSLAIEDLMNRVDIKCISHDGFFENMANEEGNLCNYKSTQGYLYMTKDAFIFLHSHTIYIPFTKVTSVRFDNLEEQMRQKKNFDLTVYEGTTSYSFQGIDTYFNVQLPDDESSESFEKEKLIKEYSYNGLYKFVEFIKEKRIKIEDRGEVNDLLKSLKASITSRDRHSKIKANVVIRNEISSGDEGDEEEDEDFNPNAKAGSSSSSSSSDDEAGSAKESGSNSDKESSE